MNSLAVVITALVLAVALLDWRKGLLGVLLIGVMQDILRKLTVGAPSYFIVWSMAVYILVALIAFINRAYPPLNTIYLGDRRISRAWSLFLLVVMLQLVHGFLRWGSPVVPIFGMLFIWAPRWR